MEPFGPLTLIVNPRAGRGAAGASLDEVVAVLRTGSLEVRVEETRAPGHATDLAAAAIEGGCRYLAAMGGDGTINEVVNGMMDTDGPRRSDLVLGLIPSGTGCDTVRTFGIPQEPVRAAAHLLGDGRWGMLDVGRITVMRDGIAVPRWFINIAEVGIGADVVSRAARMPGWLGGRAYRLAALLAIARFRPFEARFQMTGRLARKKVGSPMEALDHRGTVTMAVFANGQFFGGGLRVTPRAIPSDAMLDVLIGEGSTMDALRALRRMPTGQHIPHASLTEYLATEVRIETPGQAHVEADGEYLGTTPATVDLLPGVIALKI